MAKRKTVDVWLVRKGMLGTPSSILHAVAETDKQYQCDKEMLPSSGAVPTIHNYKVAHRLPKEDVLLEVHDASVLPKIRKLGAPWLRQVLDTHDNKDLELAPIEDAYRHQKKAIEQKYVAIIQEIHNQFMAEAQKIIRGQEE